MLRRRAVILLLLALAAMAAACSRDSTADAGDAKTRTTRRSTTTITGPPTTMAPTTTTTAPTTTTTAPLIPAGKPVAAGDPAGLAAQLALADRVLRDPASPPDQIAAAAHLQQVAYRKLGRQPEWDAAVVAALPPAMAPIVGLHADARRQFMGMHSRLPDTMPAWQIVQPEPAEQLLAYYRETEAAFGVPWQYLAAINLVETGMGRIRGLSVAGAQGPMQFMPATWEAYGEGDINAARDSILAAGRYLSANSFAADPDHALFRYNRHPNYVAGVKDYARILELDPAAFTAMYHWEIYYSTVAGDLWLPVGYALPERMPVADWLAANPQ